MRISDVIISEKSFERYSKWERNFCEKGIKLGGHFGYCTLRTFIDGLNIDYMCIVCLGVMTSLLFLWFSSENKGKTFPFAAQKNNISQYLKYVKTIGIYADNHGHWSLPYWKASKYTYFFTDCSSS